MIVVFAISYGWIAPKWFAPHRHEPLSFRIFVTLHAITLAGAFVFATGGRKPKGLDFAALCLVLIGWTYLFFFIMLNSFGA